MTGKYVGVLAATTMLSFFTMPVHADVRGGLDCPAGKVEVKSVGAFYIPAKKDFVVFFYKQPMTDQEMNATLAKAAAIVGGSELKGPGTGENAKYVSYAFKFWTKVENQKGSTAAVADIVKRAYFSYNCASSERTVNYDFKERDAKVKAVFPSASVELKQGGKFSLTSKGAYDGDPSDKPNDRIKVKWDVQGSGSVRMYE
jgi:hypothetical protein